MKIQACCSENVWTWLSHPYQSTFWLLVFPHPLSCFEVPHVPPLLDLRSRAPAAGHNSRALPSGATCWARSWRTPWPSKGRKECSGFLGLKASGPYVGCLIDLRIIQTCRKIYVWWSFSLRCGTSDHWRLPSAPIASNARERWSASSVSWHNLAKMSMKFPQNYTEKLHFWGRLKAVRCGNPATDGVPNKITQFFPAFFHPFETTEKQRPNGHPNKEDRVPGRVAEATGLSVHGIYPDVIQLGARHRSDNHG